MSAVPTMPLVMTPDERQAIDAIRTLAMDAVQQANSGHPGTPMALAPLAYTLWQKLLNYDPAHPTWPNRDRFVLSVGHASMLLYSTLHLTGVKGVNHENETLGATAISLDEIKRFRQLHSKTPGHPEYRHTAGVETTTGPLGQGLGNSVGMAIAQRWLASTFNQPGFELFNYRIYAFCGDGCMMEGISGEAASLAGHLKLSNLCWVYDSNRITIEGHTDLAYSDDVATRFAGYGWAILHVPNVNDVPALEAALHGARAITDKPTLIIVNSVIAWGAPNKADTHGAHGEPLGDEEIKLTKAAYGWPTDKFHVPPAVYAHFQAGIGARGAALSAEWNALFAKYQAAFPALAAQIEQMQTRSLPTGWDKDLPVFPTDPKGKATRDTSGQVLNVLAANVPWLLGGSADLAPSTKTNLKGLGSFAATNYAGRNFHFGIREHAMGAVMNGMAVSKLRAFGAGFLIFSDYGRPAIRLAALMELPVIYVFTHDSIGVGEDGPTHQPIEHLASLRAIPNVIVLRPGDANEVTEAWKVILPVQHTPVILALSRQPMPTLDRSKYASASGVAQGAYVLHEAPNGKPDVLLIGTGSELYLAVEAAEQLAGQGIAARVISMPSWELFERHCAQHPEYRAQVFPPSVTARVAVEMGSTFGWERYVGMTGVCVGMTTFGASAPIKDLAQHFGFTTATVVAAAKAQVGK
jgi:transketolase